VWDKGATVSTGDYNFLYGKGNENHQLGTGFFVHHRIVSAFKRVEFVTDQYLVVAKLRERLAVRKPHRSLKGKDLI